MMENGRACANAEKNEGKAGLGMKSEKGKVELERSHQWNRTSSILWMKDGGSAENDIA
jgi:hypothetical protein